MRQGSNHRAVRLRLGRLRREQDAGQLQDGAGFVPPLYRPAEGERGDGLPPLRPRQPDRACAWLRAAQVAASVDEQLGGAAADAGSGCIRGAGCSDHGADFPRAADVALQHVCLQHLPQPHRQPRAKQHPHVSAPLLVFVAFAFTLLQDGKRFIAISVSQA